MLGYSSGKDRSLGAIYPEVNSDGYIHFILSESKSANIEALEIMLQELRDIAD
jgi:hypothetical protein